MRFELLERGQLDHLPLDFDLCLVLHLEATIGSHPYALADIFLGRDTRAPRGVGQAGPAGEQFLLGDIRHRELQEGIDGRFGGEGEARSDRNGHTR